MNRRYYHFHQLTSAETYSEALRALDRLRVKELVGGPSVASVNDAGLIDYDFTYALGKPCGCASRILYFHTRYSGPVDDLGRYDDSDRAWNTDTVAWCRLVNENDGYRPSLNSKADRQARYKHMRQWLKKRLRTA